MDDIAYTSANYTIRLFDPVKFPGKLYNGKKDAPKRCRFCGRVLDSSHYSKEAHAISISLGNTKFICADECDECNEQFGRRLENDIINFFQLFLSIYQFPKRNGKERQVSGRNFEMKMSDEPHPVSDLPYLHIHMHDWKDDESITIDKLIEILKNLDLTNKTFIPQNVYKAICKFALSLMPHSMTLHYQKTLEWIQSDSFELKLPSVKIASSDRANKEPIMVLFLRNSHNARYPLCVASLRITNINMFYILPFCDESTGVDNDNVSFETFWDQFTNAKGGMGNYNNYNLSNAKRIGTKLNFDLIVKPDTEPVSF